MSAGGEELDDRELDDRSGAGPRVRPDYSGGSLVNLMASVLQAFDASPAPAVAYPPLHSLPPERLDGRNVVLLVVDGLGYDHLLEASPDGALARHVVAPITSVFPSTTATAITTFLTGEAPQQHGVTGWFTYFREIGGVLAVLPYRPRHGGAAPAVPARELLGHVPVFDRLRARSHVVVPRHIAYSDYNNAHNGGASVRPFTTLDGLFRAVTRIARTPGTPGTRNYVYAYWHELDRVAHERGIASREAAAQLAKFDTAFEEFLHDIAGTDTTVVVTADHGFIDAAAEQAVEVEGLHRGLARMLRLPLCGERRAAYCYLRPGAGAEFEDHVEQHMADLAETLTGEALVEAGWFGHGAPHPRLIDRSGDHVLLMKRRATIKDWLPGEPRHAQIGVHGGTSRREMLVPLIVARA